MKLEYLFLLIITGVERVDHFYEAKRGFSASAGTKYGEKS